MSDQYRTYAGRTMWESPEKLDERAAIVRYLRRRANQWRQDDESVSKLLFQLAENIGDGDHRL